MFHGLVSRQHMDLFENDMDPPNELHTPDVLPCY